MSQQCADGEINPKPSTGMAEWQALMATVRALTGADYKSKSEWLEALDALKQVKVRIDSLPPASPADLLMKREALVEIKGFHQRLADARREAMAEIGFVTGDKEERVSALETLARTTDGNAEDLKRANALRAEFFAIQTVASERHNFLPRVQAAFTTIKERRAGFVKQARRSRQELAERSAAGRKPDDTATIAAKRELVDRIEQLASEVETADALQRHRQAAALRKSFHAMGGRGPHQPEMVERIAAAIAVIKEQRRRHEPLEPNSPELLASRDDIAAELMRVAVQRRQDPAIAAKEEIVRQIELMADSGQRDQKTDHELFVEAVALRQSFHALKYGGGDRHRAMVARIAAAIAVIKERRWQHEPAEADGAEILAASQNIASEVERLAEDPLASTDDAIFDKAISLRDQFQGLRGARGPERAELAKRINAAFNAIKVKRRRERERAGLGADPLAARVAAQRRQDPAIVAAKEEVVRQIELLADPSRRDQKTYCELYAEAVLLRKSFHALKQGGGEVHRAMIARIAAAIEPIKAGRDEEIERDLAANASRRENYGRRIATAIRGAIGLALRLLRHGLFR